MDDPLQETIPIEIVIGSEYWDHPGEVAVWIDDQRYWQGSIHGSYDNPDAIKFVASLTCGQHHQLVIERKGKTPDQCVVMPNGIAKDQMIRLLGLTIDGINIQNKVWHKSWFEPDYDPDWVKQNLSMGMELEHHIIGETWWGHNGRWHLDFYSPFYRFMINDFR